jgi:hypothetical protein
VKAAQEELNSRGGGGFFTRLDKEKTSMDIRILPPTPSMLGKYWLEVPIWWINGKPITSPEVIGESDVIKDILDDIEADFKKQGADEQFTKLRNATKGQGMSLIQKTDAFWIPVLELEWKLDGNNQIVGIYDADGKIDPSLVKKFIKDGQAKIFDCKISLLKNINQQILTGRNGANFLNQEDGYNLIVSKTGSGRDTAYSAVKDEPMPMPEEFYASDKLLDLVEFAKGGLYTENYIEKVLYGYFYGEEIPKEPEYRFPELRQKVKGEDSGTDNAPPRSARRQAVEEKKAEEAPRRRSRAVVEESGPTEEAPRRARRNLVDDVANSDVQDD